MLERRHSLAAVHTAVRPFGRVRRDAVDPLPIGSSVRPGGIEVARPPGPPGGRSHHAPAGSRKLLSRTNEQLELRIDERIKWLTLLHQVTRAIQEAAHVGRGGSRGARSDLRRRRMAGWLRVRSRSRRRKRDRADLSAACATSVSGRSTSSPRGNATRARQNLPGLVYDDGIVRWVNEAEELAALVPVRQAAVREAGFVSAVAMPITFGPQVIGVLELFSDEPHTPDQTLVTLMVDLSAQIGKIVERERMTAEMADLVVARAAGAAAHPARYARPDAHRGERLELGARPPAPRGRRRRRRPPRSDRAAGEARAEPGAAVVARGCFRSTSIRST